MTRKRHDLKKISAYRKVEKQMRRGSSDTEVDALKEIFLDQKPKPYSPPPRSPARLDTPYVYGVPPKYTPPSEGKPSLLQRILKVLRLRKNAR